MKVRGNRTRKPTAKNIALELGSNAEKYVKEKKQDPGDGDDDDDDDEITEYEKTKRRELYQAYMKFEKKHGDRERIENVIINNRRQSYQKAIDMDPYDNDSWFEWAKLEQDHYTSTSTASSSSSSTTTTTTATTGTPDAVREVYERAVAQVPPTTDQKITGGGTFICGSTTRCSRK